MAKRKSTAEFKPNKRHKLPPITAGERRALDQFLQHALASGQHALEGAKHANRIMPSDRNAGMVTYWRHHCKTIESLIVMTAQRRSA